MSDDGLGTVVTTEDRARKGQQGGRLGGPLVCEGATSRGEVDDAADGDRDGDE